MQKKVIRSATNRLLWAKSAISAFENAATVGDQRKAWWEFLTNTSAVYEKLKAGAEKAGGKSAPWMGRIVNQRKKDPLLNYVHHARNCDYHGIEESVEADGFSWGIRNASGGMMFGLVKAGADEDSTSLPENLVTTIGVNGVDLTPDEAAAYGLGPPMKAASLRLVAVTDSHYGDTFYPPSQHFGNQIDGTCPLTVGKAALAYLEGVVKEAESLSSD